MKYFVQRLPVPGELELGCWFMDTAGVIRMADETDIALENYLTQRIPAQQRYEEFLCKHESDNTYIVVQQLTGHGLSK